MDKGNGWFTKMLPLGLSLLISRGNWKDTFLASSVLKSAVIKFVGFGQDSRMSDSCY